MLMSQEDTGGKSTIGDLLDLWHGGMAGFSLLVGQDQSLKEGERKSFFVYG